MQSWGGWSYRALGVSWAGRLELARTRATVTDLGDRLGYVQAYLGLRYLKHTCAETKFQNCQRPEVLLVCGHIEIGHSGWRFAKVQEELRKERGFGACLDACEGYSG